jgi:hypothetical protein
MDIQSSTKISKCSICQNRTNLVCSGCSEDPLNENKKTRYCSRDCQSVDWHLHKRSCQMLKARKDLYRAGSILQQIIFLCREKLFDLPIHRIEYDNNRMLLHPLPAKDFGSAPEDRLFQFPSEQCETEEDRKALLSYLACSDLTLYLEHIPEYLLAGESQGRMTSRIRRCHQHPRSSR